MLYLSAKGVVAGRSSVALVGFCNSNNGNEILEF